MQNVIEELKPCVEFLGFEMNQTLADCIRNEQEGSYHRDPMSKEDLQFVLTEPFTEKELDYFNRTKVEISQKMLENSVNHGTADFT